MPTHFRKDVRKHPTKPNADVFSALRRYLADWEKMDRDICFVCATNDRGPRQRESKRETEGVGDKGDRGQGVMAFP